MRPKGQIAAALVAVVFGALTVLSGGRALFGGAAVGDAVPFVLWFNFLSGFAYIFAGAGIWLRKGWAPGLAALLAVAIVGMFGLFGLHIAQGGAFEMRTVGAMALRAGVWVFIALYLHRMKREFGGAA